MVKENKLKVYLPNNNIMYSQTASTDQMNHIPVVCESLTNYYCYLLTWTQSGTEVVLLTSETNSKEANTSLVIKAPSMITGNPTALRSVSICIFFCFNLLSYWSYFVSFSDSSHLLPECVFSIFQYVSVCGLQWLCSCRLFLGGVCFTRYSIFLLLCQSHDCMGCYNWLEEEQERKER